MPKTRTNQEWVDDLTSTGPEQAEAIDDLRQLLLRAALYTFNRNPGDLRDLDPKEKYALAEDCAQNALIAALSQLKEFRGEGKFTTWAFKFSVNFALPCLRRERWKRVSLDTFDENLDSLNWVEFRQENASNDPDRAALQAEILTALRDFYRPSRCDSRSPYPQAATGAQADRVRRSADGRGHAAFRNESQRRL